MIGKVGSAIAAVAAALAPAAALGGERVDIELVLAVDVSGSVDAAELALQRAGLVAAFRDPGVVPPSCVENVPMMTTPPPPLPIAAVPSAFVPMKFP